MTIEVQEQKSSAEMIDSNVNDQLNSVDANSVNFETTDVPLNTQNVKSFLQNISLWNRTITFDDIKVNNDKTISLNTAFDRLMKDMFPGKLNVEMKDIYTLSDTQKADLAWKLSAIQPLSLEQKNKKIKLENGDIFLLGSMETALLYWVTIWTTTNLPKNDVYSVRWVTSDISKYSISKSDFEQYSSLVSQYTNDIQKELFKSFYETWDKMPAIMPSTYGVATWDLHTTTTWVLWIENWARNEFMYDFETKNTQTNGLSFWPVHSPMNITVWAEGIDEIGWKISFIFSDPSGKEYSINGTYTTEWLSFGDNGWLPWVVLEWNTISIPETYKNWNIKVKTESNQYSNGSYDEIVFPISINNWRLLEEQRITIGDINNLENNLNYKLWDYKLTPEQLLSVDKTIKDIGYYGDRILWETLPISLYAWVDDVSIPDSDIGSRFLNNKELFEDDNYTIIKNNLQNWKIKDIRNQYQQKIDLMSAQEMGNSSWSGDQLRAQKLLTKLRFLTVLESMDNNAVVKRLLNEDKLSISLDYKNEKASWLMVEPFDYVEKK